MGNMNDNDQNRQASDGKAARGASRCNAPVPPAGYTPKDAPGQPQQVGQAGEAGTPREASAAQPQAQNDAPANQGAAWAPPSQAQQPHGQPFAYHQPASPNAANRSDGSAQTPGNDAETQPGNGADQQPQQPGHELQNPNDETSQQGNRQGQQYWEDPFFPDQQVPGPMNVDQIPGYLKGICVASGLLFGLIGVLFVWIVNMRAPRDVRGDLMKWSIVGFFIGVIVDIVVFSAAGGFSSTGMLGSTLGGGTSAAPSGSGGIF